MGEHREGRETRAAPARVVRPTVGRAAAALAAGMLAVWPFAAAHAQEASPLAAQHAATARLDPASADAGEGVALWRVGDEDTTVWLFGTIHLLDPAIVWRRPAVDAALADADVVYLEADTSPAAQQRATPVITELGFYPPSQRLDAALSPEARARLRAAAAAVDLPLFLLNRQRPWFASVTLGVAWIQAEGGDPQAGADRVIERAAQAAGQEIRYLETVEEQVRILASLPEDAALQALEATLEQVEAADDYVAAMFSAWARGDARALDGLVNASLGEGEGVRTVYLTERNAAWTEEIVRVIEEEPGVVFVAVGAGHLIGADSVQEMLAARGYRAARR